MENEHENLDVNLEKKITAELLEKSAKLKIKNAQVKEKLKELKTEADVLFGVKSGTSTNE